MGKSRHSSEGGGQGRHAPKSARDKRRNELMAGMRGGSPTADEVAQAAAAVAVEASVPPAPKPEAITQAAAPESAAAPAKAVWKEFIEDQGDAVGESEDGTKVTFDGKSGMLAVTAVDGAKTVRAATLEEVKNLFASATATEASKMETHVAEVSQPTVAPETSTPPVAPEDVLLDTDTVNKDGSMDEIRALLAQAKEKAAAPASNAPTSLEDIFGDREVPASNAEMLTRLGKIKSKKVREEKIKSYLEKVVADEAEKAAKRQKREPRGKSKKPKNEKPEALPSMPVVPPPPQPEAGQQPEKLDAKSAYSAQLSELENALKNRYPDWENAPSKVLERYFDLTTEQLSNNASGDKVKIEKTATDIDAFMSELQTPPVPVVPPPPAAEAEEQTAPAQEPEVDASEFAAPQYAKRGMQEEMDALNGITLESGAIELPGAGNSRRAMYSQLEGVSPERAEALLGGDRPAPLEQEATRAETKSKLSSLIEKLTKMSGAVSEGFSKSKNYLNERAKQIDAQAETSGAERVTRRMGEIYNKLNLREKLGIGLVLGASTVVTGGASIYLPYAFVGLIGVQRAFGMASMYLSQEKALQNAKIAESGQLISVKERAAFDALVSGVLMGAAIGKGIQLANEYGLVERTREWLGGMLGHNVGTPEVSAPARPTTGELPTSPDASLPSVEAKAGDGYERMLKNLWEQSKNLDPNKFPEESDIRRLLEAGQADPKSIDTVVHQLATENEYYKTNGTSVLVNVGDRMTIDPKTGGIFFGDEYTAPEGARVTPALHHDTAPIHSDPSMRVEPNPDFPHEVTRVDAEDVGDVLTVEEPAAGASEAPAVEAPSEVPAGHEIVTNALGVSVATAEPHIYSDPGGAHTLVFGGSPEDQAGVIRRHLLLHPTDVVYGTDSTRTYRIPYHIAEGKVVAGPQMRTAGLFGTKFGSSWMKPPGPDELEKLIT